MGAIKSKTFFNKQIYLVFKQFSFVPRKLQLLSATKIKNMDGSNKQSGLRERI